MRNEQAIKIVAEMCDVSPFVLNMFIESYSEYREVRFGPIGLLENSLERFKDYLKEQRDLSRAIDPGATRQYEQMLELIDIYELEEVNK